MKIENRQHFLIMLVAVGAALLIGNSLIYSPLAKLWSARSLQIRNLKNQVADGKNLIKSATILTLAFGFLAALDRLIWKRSWVAVMVAALLLAAALLTRYAGIALLLPLAVQAWRRRSWRETVVGVVGVGLFAALWLGPMLWLRWSGEASSTYYQTIPDPVHFHPLELLGAMEGATF